MRSISFTVIRRSEMTVLLLLLIQFTLTNELAKAAAPANSKSAPSQNNKSTNSKNGNTSAKSATPQENLTAARRSLILPSLVHVLSRSNSTSIIQHDTQIGANSQTVDYTSDLPNYSFIDEQPERVSLPILSDSSGNVIGGATGAPGKPEQLSIGEGTLKSVGNNTNGSARNVGLAKVFSMSKGSVLVSHYYPVKIETGKDNVEIKSGSAAFVVSLESETAVYNLSGQHHDSVAISHEGHSYDVPIGTVLILSNSDKGNSFESIKLSNLVRCSKPVLVETTASGEHIYSAEFSYVSALEKCHQFQEWLRSTNPSKRNKADKLLKIAAASLITK